MKKLIFSLILAALVMPYLHAQECQQTATATVTLTQRELTDAEKQVTCGETFESEIAFYRVTPGALPGIFTVSEDNTGKKTYVRFSSGNLQYLPASINGDSVWRFAPNQYDFIGDGTTYGGTADTYSIGNQYREQAYNHLSVTTINSVEKQADEQWFDLFNYGTSGYSGFHPLKRNCPGTWHTLDANTDWGRYNPIFMGGDKKGLWRTMTSTEWENLLNRKASDNVTLLYGLGRIDMGGDKYVNGLFLFPDGFADIKDPDNSSNTLHTTRGVCTYETNTFSLTQFAALEKVGVVFLPAAGYYDLKSSSSFYSGRGKYHSATTNRDFPNSCYLDFTSSAVAVYCNQSYWSKGDCVISVRLVQDFVKTTH